MSRINPTVLAMLCIPLAGFTGFFLGFLARPALLPPRVQSTLPAPVDAPAGQGAPVQEVGQVQVKRLLDEPIDHLEFKASVIGLERSEITAKYGKPASHEMLAFTTERDGPAMWYTGSFTGEKRNYAKALLQFKYANGRSTCTMVEFYER